MLSPSIAENTGENGRQFCEKVAAAKGNYGYSAAEDRFEDLVVAGIIDPAKVFRYALQNAASVPTLLLTSDVLITKTSRNDMQRTQS